MKIERRLCIIAELGAYPLEELIVQQQAGHLVLIFIGHEFEQIACHRFAELGLTWHAAVLDVDDFPNELNISASIRRALVEDQLWDANLRQAPYLAGKPRRC